MVLINLKLIGQVALQGLEQKFTLDSYCYNHHRRTQPEDDIFVFLYKGYKQADNLFDQLKKLHQVCSDFATGNLQPYVDEHEYYRNGSPDEETDIFNPFDSITYPFHSRTIDDLPAQIEQYVELKQMVSRFSAVQAKKREGFKKFFGELTVYQATTGPDGEGIMVPLDDETREQHAIQAEIEEVNIEYCLDRYNEFYLICQSLIDSHQATGSYMECATEILALFAPYSFTPTPLKFYE